MNNKDILKKAEIGDIIFTYDKQSFLSNLIFKFLNKDKKTKISHSVLYIGAGLVIESLWSGVTIRSKQVYENSRFEILIGKVKEATEDQINSVIKDVIQYANRTKYSYLQLLLIFLRKLIPFKTNKDYDKKNMTCSELIHTVYNNSGILLVPCKNSSFVTPMDLYFSSKVFIKN